MLARARAKREAVQMREKRFGYFPKAFRWRGREYEVEAVERCWTKARGHPELCFRVRCPEGAFELVQDVQLNAWHVVVNG